MIRNNVNSICTRFLTNRKNQKPLGENSLLKIKIERLENELFLSQKDYRLAQDDNLRMRKALSEADSREVSHDVNLILENEILKKKTKLWDLLPSVLPMVRFVFEGPMYEGAPIAYYTYGNDDKRYLAIEALVEAVRG